MQLLASNQLLERKEDTVFSSKQLEELHHINAFPVFMGCTDQDPSEDICAPQTWQISKTTGVLQLKSPVPLEYVYIEQHNDSFGVIWQEHHERLAYIVSKQKPKNVLEIGAATCKLASFFDTNNIEWSIVEPNAVPMKNINIIPSFFDSNFANNHPKTYDVLVHSHCFEHMYNPRDFLKTCKNILAKDGRMIFSVPNMLQMLEKKYTNCLNFEHTFLLSEDLIDELLRSTGFLILDKFYFKEDHSIMYTCALTDSDQFSRMDSIVYNPKIAYKRNKRMFLDYISYYSEEIRKINDKLEDIPEPRQIYLFGAHIFSLYLLYNGLDQKRLVGILDNSPLKISRRLYGTELKVFSPKCLHNLNQPVVILKAGQYNQEIASDIISNINATVEFLE